MELVKDDQYYTVTTIDFLLTGGIHMTSLML